MNGTLTTGARLRFVQAGAVYNAEEVGVRRPDPTPIASLGAGEVGYLIAGIKDVGEARSGETITTAAHPAPALEGYKEPKPMVFCGIYPIDGDEFPTLREALEKLRLNDSSYTFQPESSGALGFGFRCGFLGLLHMEIIRERLEREFNLSLIATAPSVQYVVHKENGDVITIDNPSELPPATEVVTDFFDQMKSRTQGYASLDYEPSEYRQSNLVKVDILLNAVPVDAFSMIVHKDKSYGYGLRMTEKLKELIPRQLFDVPIQAAIGGRIIARETVKAKRKDVLAKCYGGDISRKRKLLEKQKEGKKRMKNIGRVEVPQEAFVSALRLDD